MWVNLKGRYVTAVILSAAFMVPPGISCAKSFDRAVSSSYKAMEKQAQDYCAREYRRLAANLKGQSDEADYIHNCKMDVLDEVLTQIADPQLSAYHKATVQSANYAISPKTISIGR